MTSHASIWQAQIDQEAARIRDLLDRDHTNTLALMLHTDSALADVVRLTIGTVVLDLRNTLTKKPSAFYPTLHAWAQLAEPGPA